MDPPLMSRRHQQIPPDEVVKFRPLPDIPSTLMKAAFLQPNEVLGRVGVPNVDAVGV
jgi:hypothetical protein